MQSLLLYKTKFVSVTITSWGCVGGGRPGSIDRWLPQTMLCADALWTRGLAAVCR